MTDAIDRPRLAETLDLLPHPEGGWFRETWRSPVEFSTHGYDGRRSCATCIYFLLDRGETSRWHRVASTEIWLWHSGGPLLLSLGGTTDEPDVEPRVVTLGPDIAEGQQPQVIISAGHWQAARPGTDAYALVTCVVSPGFDFADFELLPDSSAH